MKQGKTGHRGAMLAIWVLVQTGRDRATMTECCGLFQSKHLFKGRHFDGQIIILCVS